MKKSTLLKIISMVLTAVLVLSFASCFSFGGGDDTSEDDANKVTLYLDPNGGELPEGQSDEIKVTIGEKIGKLPTPTRPGYKFLGWFEDGDERYEIDRKTEAEDYDMDIVALWEAAGTLYSVEFTVATDETFVGDKDYYEIVEGQKISSILDSLPTAERADYKFIGWQDQNKNTVTKGTVVEGDLVLSPKWEKIIYCLDGTENHPWNAWQESAEATCTEPAQSSRVCGACGHTEYNVTQEALGHKYGDYELTVSESGSLLRARTCATCEYIEKNPLKNITYDSFNVPTITGGVYGSDRAGSLIDGVYNAPHTSTVAPNGTGAVSLTLTAKDANGVYIDIFCMTGNGSSQYKVTVTYTDGTSKEIGIGSFGSGAAATKAFTVENTVVKIVVHMETPANGTDSLQEMSACLINK